MHTEYFKHDKKTRLSRSPTSFRQLSQSIQKRLDFTNKKKILSKLDILKTHTDLNPKKQPKNIFTKLLKSRSPSAHNNIQKFKYSQKSTHEESSILSKGNQTSKFIKEWKGSGKKVIGLQFKGVRQKINTKKSTTQQKSPQKYFNGLVIGKKLIKQSSLIQKQNKSTLNINNYFQYDNCESVIHSRDHGVSFDMSPTL